MGALDGGPYCRMVIIRNGNDICLCRLLSLMSNVESDKMLSFQPPYYEALCVVSISRNIHVPLFYILRVKGHTTIRGDVKIPFL